jgi:predicted TIM-barrel fold metal-dependent hydrolase
MKVYLFLILISQFAAGDLMAQIKKDLQSDPKWVQSKYGAWGGAEVGAKPGTMDNILLKDYAPVSSVVAEVTHIAKAKYPAIDAHTHVLASTPKEVADWVKTMDEVGIETSVILTGATGEKFDKLVALYLTPYPKRFLLFCGMYSADVDQKDYPQRAVAELERCYMKGARGVGEWIDKGSGYSSGKLHPDDKRLDLFWEKCAELKMPVSFHIADHPSAWRPLDVYQERTPDFQHFNRYGKDGLSYEELLQARNRTIEKHPRTTFLACHLANEGNDLERLSKLLDRYPNLYLDISARDYELGRTPRAALKFLTKNSGRVLFGTDMSREKNMYQAWWRLLESEDEFIIGRVWWRYYGLGLPDSVLEALYRANAKKILNWR